MRGASRWWLSAALVVALPLGAHAGTNPHDFSGAWRVPASAVPAAGAPTARRDCTSVFAAGVGAESTAHIVMGRETMVIVHERNHTVRRIHINGQHPAGSLPSVMGHSIGWWEGDTLVVETIGLPGDRTVVERLRSVDNGRALEVVVNARAALAESHPTESYVEDICEVGGTAGAAPAAPVTAATTASAPASTAAATVAAGPAHFRPLFEGVWRITQPVRTLHVVGGGAPPLTVAARKVYERHSDLFRAGRASEFNGSDACVPPGEPRTAHGGQPFEIVQGEDALFFGYAWNRMLRLVYLRIAPRTGAAVPAYYGHWNGHWDGEMLVLEGTGFRANTVLDATGLPHSAALRLTQQLSLGQGGNELEIRTTFDDPQTFTRSWSTVQHYRRQREAVINETICTPVAAASTAKEE
jgi:hypothetical protein